MADRMEMAQFGARMQRAPVTPCWRGVEEWRQGAAFVEDRPRAGIDGRGAPSRNFVAHSSRTHAGPSQVSVTRLWGFPVWLSGS